MKAIFVYFCMIAAAAAQTISTTSPDLKVTPTAGGGYAIDTRSPIIDQSSAGGPILASAAENTIKIGGFPYTIAPAGSAGFQSGWTTMLINVSKTAATLTSNSTFEGAGNAGAISLSPGDWVALIADGSNYLALSGRSLGAPVSSGTAFVTGETSLGTIRNDSNAAVGFYILVGSAPITVTDLGRWVVSGNAGQHVVSIYDNTCKSLGGVTVNTSGAPSGAFAYASLLTPIVLAAGQHYYVLSTETVSGERWYNSDTVLTTTAAASIVNAAFVSGTSCLLGGGYPVPGSGPGHSYGFPSFKYH